MKQKKLVFLLAMALLLFTGCSTPDSQPQDTNQLNQQQNADQVSGNNQQTKKNTIPSIGGIHLGDKFSEVQKALGQDYKETYYEEPGHFPESWYMREYQNGFSVIAGKNSEKVLEMDTDSPDFETNLGIKVGDSAKTVSEKYGTQYKEYERPHGNGPVEGFYRLEEGIVIIFDYNKDDYLLINTDVNPDSKVEKIILTYAEHLD